MESRTQGSRPRPRTQKKIRGQGQEPRTQARVLSKKKKKGVHKNFSGDLRSPKTKKRSSQNFFNRTPQKNVFQKIFRALHKILTIQKILLSSCRGQANFRGLEAPRPRTWPSRPKAKDFKICPRGLEASKPRTSSRTPPLYSTMAAFSRWCHLVTSLYLVMSYGSVFVLCCNVDQHRSCVCVGTMRGRGHDILWNGNQAKIVKALTCDPRLVI